MTVRVLGWILFSLLLLLCVLPQGSTRVFTWPWVFYAQVLMIAPLLLAGFAYLTSGQSSGIPGGGALAFCGASVGLSVLLSRSPHFSLEAALPLWGGLAFTGWLAHRLRGCASDATRFLMFARLAGVAFVAPVISSVWIWITAVAPGVATSDSLGAALSAVGNARNPYPFGHPNYTGGFALVALPWLATLAAVERGRWRAAWMAASALGALLIFSSGSRGALLGALVLLAAGLVLARLTGRISARAGFGLLAGGFVGALGLALVNERLRTMLVDSIVSQYPNVGDVQRLAMLQGGWLLGLQRLWTGHGPGMVPFVYPEVRGQLVGGVETSYQLHNAYAHQWATTGLLGLAAGLVLIYGLIRCTRRWLRHPPGIARAFALGSAATLVGYAAMAATDYQLDVIGLVAALSLHTALLLAAPEITSPPLSFRPSTPRLSTQLGVSRFAFRVSPSNSRLWLKTSGIFLIGSALAAAAFLIPHWRARELHWSAWATTAEGDSFSLHSKLLAASNAAPWNTHYRNQLGLQLAGEAERSDDPVKRAIARDVLASSLALDPAQEPVHAALGWLWLPDDPVQAGKHFHRALALVPDRDTLHLGLALSRLRSGDRVGAIRALALECLVNPPFVASPLWREPALAPLQSPVRAQLGELISEVRKHPAIPAWRQRDLEYFAAFLRWWSGGPPPDEGELAGADPRQRSFFAAVTAGMDAASWPAPWQELASGKGASPGLGVEDGETKIPDLLRSGEGESARETDLTIERGHYPLMHRNLDGPGYLDLAPRKIDPFRQRYVVPLFPAAGLIPGLVMKDLQDMRETP